MPIVHESASNSSLIAECEALFAQICKSDRHSLHGRQLERHLLMLLTANDSENPIVLLYYGLLSDQRSNDSSGQLRSSIYFSNALKICRSWNSIDDVKYCVAKISLVLEKIRNDHNTHFAENNVALEGDKNTLHVINLLESGLAIVKTR
jgi:hypothetical protein